MTKILTDIASVYNLNIITDENKSDIERPQYYVISKSDSFEDCYYLIENLIICQKIYVEENGIKFFKLTDFIKGFSDAIDFFKFPLLYDTEIDEANHAIFGGKRHGFPKNSFYDDLFGKSESQNIELLVAYIKRAAHYIIAAEDNDLYYSLHPNRYKLLQDNMIRNFEKGFLKRLIKQVDKKFIDSKAGQFAKIDVSIPAIVEHIKHFAKKNKITLIESILHTRQSKNAKLFRDYFSNLDYELRNLTSRKRIKKIQIIQSDLGKLVDGWIEDLELNVSYKKRTIKLSKILGIGRVCELFGFDKKEIKDPLLTQEKKHLLFLNELYRAT